MNEATKQQLEQNLRQLERAVDSGISFKKAFYIVFSDYASVNSINYYLDNLNMSEKIRNLLEKNLKKLK